MIQPAIISNYENWSYDRVLANTNIYGDMMVDYDIGFTIHCQRLLGNMISVISSSIAIYQTGSSDGCPGRAVVLFGNFTFMCFKMF